MQESRRSHQLPQRRREETFSTLRSQSKAIFLCALIFFQARMPALLKHSGAEVRQQLSDCVLHAQKVPYCLLLAAEEACFSALRFDRIMLDICPPNFQSKGDKLQLLQMST